MALNPLHRVQFHRLGRFTQDGRGWTYAFSCWALTPQLPLAGHWSGDGHPDCYTLPMDDDEDHWLRLEAEAWARDHYPDAQAGRPHGLVHCGGLVHPEPRLGHIRLGGSLAWEHDPHPVVQERLERLRAMDLEALVTHFCGPDPFRGVLQGAD
jgi:hypothetical protein